MNLTQRMENDLIEQLTHSLISQGAVDKIEAEMLSMDQVDCPVLHHFSNGVYVREVRIKAGTFSIGHHQKTEHLNIILKGKVLMLRDDGTVSVVSAPLIYTAQPGRKIGHIIEDMVWLNVYPTDETDIETLEKTYLDKSDGWVADKETQLKIEMIAKQIDREDFTNCIKCLGFDADKVRSQSEFTGDQIPFPKGQFEVVVSVSPIEGKGLFATSQCNAGDIIAPARINGKRTPAGRYINHSANPNAKMLATGGGDISVIAIDAIGGCKGGQNGDEITVDYRQAYKVNKGALCQE